MNLSTKRLGLCFIAALLLTFIAPHLLHSLHLLFFPAFLVITFYQRPLFTCVWYAFFCGLLIDLISDNTRLGLNGLAYTLSTLLLYNQKKNFFSDSLTTLPVMTFFFSALATGISFLLLPLLGKEVSLYFSWVVTDVIILPAMDGVFAFGWFILPFFLAGRRPRKGEEYFTD